MRAHSFLRAGAPLVAVFVAFGSTYGCNLLLDVDGFRSSDGGSSQSTDGGLDGGRDAAPDVYLPPPPGAFSATWAQWPMPNSEKTGPLKAEYTQVAGKNEVTETSTGLTWLQTTKSAATFDGTEGALAACPPPYRLPSRIELVSLLDLDTTGETLFPASAKITAQPGLYWTGSYVSPLPPAGESYAFWMVDFSSGATVAKKPTGTTKYGVICVRGVQ